MGSSSSRSRSGTATRLALWFPARAFGEPPSITITITITILLLLFGIHAVSSFSSYHSVVSTMGCRALLFSPQPCSIFHGTGTTQSFQRSRWVDPRSRNRKRCCHPIPTNSENDCRTGKVRLCTKRESVNRSGRGLHALASRSSYGGLFSQRGDTGGDDCEEDRTDTGSGESETSKPGRVRSCASDFSYGFNHVHANFLALSGALYLRTIAFTAPFIFVLFMVLPSCMLSPNRHHQALAVSIQRSLQHSFTFLANASMRFYLRPLLVAFQVGVSMFSAVGSNKTPKNRVAGAWGSSYSAPRSRFYLLVLLGPIVEELVFRWAFYKLWKALFRSLPETCDEPSTDTVGHNHNPGTESKAKAKAKSDHPPSVSNKRKLKSWFLASGAVFAVTHLVNFFPFDVHQYSDNVGNILLPRGSIGERCLLRLFPGDVVDTHTAFCLVNMVLYGAIFQGMHCFINTMILYGPLFEARGIFASIGAHMAWNTNVMCLAPNIKLRLVRRLLSVPVSRLRKVARTKTADANGEGLQE